MSKWVSTSTITCFSQTEYWEDHYKKSNELYEWYQPWQTFKPAIGDFLLKCTRLLNIGSGNSPMSLDLVNDGVKQIDNIDISDTVTQQMKARYEGDERMRWHTMDCRSLKFADEVFDGVIEKGTIDALSCDTASATSIHKMLKEALRVMKKGSYFVSISFGAPTARLSHFENPDLAWSVLKPIQVPKIMIPGAFYYVYVAQKF